MWHLCELIYNAGTAKLHKGKFLIAIMVIKYYCSAVTTLVDGLIFETKSKGEQDPGNLSTFVSDGILHTGILHHV